MADETAHTVSVFSASAQGDVAPLRVLKGPKTLMKIPSDVFLDTVNNEMWVASFGNHLALAYKLGASGDTAPVRIIRGSPLNTPGAMISNPFAVAYDTKREEILVTSCVANPRIGAFQRTADKNALPVRTIQGANTKTNRTMHAISYDEVNDEIVVPSRAGQAIMTFRGAANGDEAPIRIIQGPKTGLRQFDKLSVDPVNDEVFAFFGSSVVFFDRKANGDVAPKRILNPPYLRAQQARVDPIRNLLIVAGGDKIWIFDRTAEGRDAQPKAVIGGPASGMRVGNGMSLLPADRHDPHQRARRAGRRARRDRAVLAGGAGVGQVVHRRVERRRSRRRAAAVDDRRAEEHAAPAARRHPRPEEQDGHRQRQVPERRADVFLPGNLRRAAGADRPRGPAVAGCDLLPIAPRVPDRTRGAWPGCSRLLDEPAGTSRSREQSGRSDP